MHNLDNYFSEVYDSINNTDNVNPVILFPKVINK